MAAYEMYLSDDTKDKNFYIMDNKAYTEDDILVYNIFVYKIPKSLGVEDIRRYFSQYGDVRKVRLVADKKRSRRAAPKVGFVNFADPTVAAKVLQKIYHEYKNLRICVKAGDSWNQPNATTVRGPVEHETVGPDDAGAAAAVNNDDIDGDDDDADVAGQQCNILSLNDDCLEYIFGLLKLRDRVRFARVCQRFRNVFQMFCKRECKQFDLKNIEHMTLWDVRDLLRFAGPYIETLDGYLPFKNRERIAEFIGNFCPNMKCLSLDESRMRPDCLRKLMGKLKNVTELHLNDCSLNDNIILAMLQLPKLETLELSENYELTGKNLDRLKQLKVLNLYGCGNIQSSYLCEVCKTMQNLTVLDIRRCLRLDASALEAMIKYCKQLEVLKMSCRVDLSYERVALLPRLKQLELLSTSLIPGVSWTELFANLAKHKADQLESLKILTQNFMTYERAGLISQLKQLKKLVCGTSEKLNDDCLRKLSELPNLEELVIKNCTAVTNTGLLALVRNCKHLKRVNVQRCNKVTTPFVFEAIKILRNSTEKRSGPIWFHVYGTGINPCDVVNLQIADDNPALSLIKLTFETFPTDADVDSEMDIYDILGDDDNFGLDDDDDDYIDEIDEEDDFYVPDDSDDDDMHLAYNIFGRYLPHGFDINDVIW